MNKTIIAYKGFDKDLKCRDFQYEVGKEYELPNGEKPEVCSNGFHACESPLEVLNYYFLDDNANLSRFCEVEQSGEFSNEENTTKVASSKIKIREEIKFDNFIKLGIEWLKERSSTEKVDTNSEIHLNDNGDCSAKIVSSGNDVQIGSSGNFAKIVSSGDSAKIASTGDFAKIASSGNDVQIGSSGDYARIGSSDNYVQIGSSGNFARIGSTGDVAKIASSGDDVQIASSGYSARIGSSGYSVRIGSTCEYAQIGSSGEYAKIDSSGNNVQIGSSGGIARIASSGDSAHIASSGNSAQIDSTGEDSVIMCAGHNSKAKARKGSWITLAEWYKDISCGKMRPKCVKAEYVDGERIKEDTWYKLVDGEFVSLDTLED